MMARINSANPGTNYTSLWANMGSANDNPMGMHWTGMVFGLGLAVSFGYWCTDFLQVQRVMTARTLRDAQNGTIIGAGFKMLVPLIVTIPGLLGLALLLPTMGVKLLPENEAIMTGGHSYNQVLPLMMSRYLGPGLLGLGVTGMIAGFMSGMAGNVSAFATVWTYDVYRPLIRRRASDHHYVMMGRWCSIIGVLIGIGTAYAALLFSNILAYLQVLVIFFIVPLFGVVLVGMLWKQATRAGGFWALLTGTLASMGMYAFVHWFPAGYVPFLAGDCTNLPAMAASLEKPANPVARLVAAELSPKTVEVLSDFRQYLAAKPPAASLFEKVADRFREEDTATQRLRITLVGDLNRLLYSSTLDRLPSAGTAGSPAESAVRQDPRPVAEIAHAARSPGGGAEANAAAGTESAQAHRALLNAAFPHELAAMRRFEPTQINPRHAEIIATSPKAQDMAVNMYSGFWSLLLTMGTLVMVSLFTKPKLDDELKDLVYGLSPLPDEGRTAWYRRPVLWAAVVLAVLVGLNIIFW
jgi:hypothetical protein